MTRPHQVGHRSVALTIGAIVLLAAMVFTTILSHRVDPYFDPGQAVDLMIVGSWILAGAAFLWVIWSLTRSKTLSHFSLMGILLLGGLMRMVLLFSTPLFENDFYRYLWDGAVTAHGHNPYLVAPESVIDESAPPDLLDLSDDPNAPLRSINHPSLRTIYPPFAQAAFALAYWIQPFGVGGLRLVFLAFDVAALLAIWLCLKKLDLPRQWVAVYWLNPLLIVTVVNQCHMDGLVFPLILGALLLTMRRRLTLACVFLALAIGTKIWPVVFLPIMLRSARSQPKKWLPGVILFSALLALICVPILQAQLDQSSGFVRYAEAWHNNAPLFGLITEISQWLCAMGGFHPGHGNVVARLFVAAILVAFVVYRSIPEIVDNEDLIKRCTQVAAAVFLLSPTQFPWYACWILPLLALHPWWPFLLYTALMPLYHLHYTYSWIVWVEHGPVMCWLLVEIWVARRRTPIAGRIC